MTLANISTRELESAEIDQVSGAVIEPTAEPLTLEQMIEKALYDAAHPFENLEIH